MELLGTVTVSGIAGGTCERMRMDISMSVEDMGMEKEIDVAPVDTEQHQQQKSCYTSLLSHLLFLQIKVSGSEISGLPSVGAQI